MVKVGILAAAALALCGPVQAGDFALVLANRAYEGAPDNTAAAAAVGLGEDLKARGFTVFEAHDTSASVMRRTAALLHDEMERDTTPDRVIIAVSGYFAHGATDGWLLQSSAGTVTPLNAGARGIPLSALAGLAARAPGQAVMLIAPAEGTLTLGGGLETGPGVLNAPQGVTVVMGAQMGWLRRWARDTLLASGLSLDGALSRTPAGAQVSGFRSAAVGFGGVAATTRPDSPMGEMSYWSAVQDIGTEAALRAYLARYPQGIFAPEAKARLDRMTADPLARVREAEAALDLSRNDRRQVQRNLSLLGFDPRGIDGLFGRGSRAAIAAWQRAQDYADHGFLSRGQVAELQRQADIRAAELEREARLRREAEERADRQLWARVRKDEAGLRSYLREYPDGIYSDDARARLNLIMEEQRNRTEARERRAWDTARNADTIEGYQRFLAEYPRSGFAEGARERMAELTDAQNNRARIEALRAEEAQVVPGTGARVLVEKLLAVHGQEPGPADGKFTRETRKAIRRFQRSRELPVTGYVSQQTMVMLMLGQREKK